LRAPRCSTITIIDDPTDALPPAGGIKAFAVTAKTRLAAAPDVPTVDEAGLPGFYFSRWHGLCLTGRRRKRWGCSEGRDREMVADHQGGEHQGGMTGGGWPRA
jgi:hypothetical protein